MKAKIVYHGPQAGGSFTRKKQRKRKKPEPEPIPLDKEFYTSAEVSTLANVTLRQLQWWDEQAILKPWRHVGHSREYALAQLPHIQALAELRRAGVSLQRAKKVIRKHPDSLPSAVAAIVILRELGLTVR